MYVPLDRNWSKGYGFVEFKYNKDADDAIKEMDGYELDGFKLEVQEAKYGRKSRDEMDKGGKGKGRLLLFYYFMSCFSDS